MSREIANVKRKRHLQRELGLVESLWNLPVGFPNNLVLWPQALWPHVLTSSWPPQAAVFTMSSQYFPNSSVEKTSEYRYHHTIPDENISLLYPLLSKWNLLPRRTWNIPPQLPTIFLSKSKTFLLLTSTWDPEIHVPNWLLSSSKARTPRSQPIHYSDKHSKAKVACKMPYNIKISSLSIPRLL